jgi:MYND finger
MMASSDEAFDLNADIAAANAAWTCEDVAVSAAGAEMRDNNPNQFAILTPQVAFNKDPVVVNIALHKGIRKFMSNYKERFAMVWRNMSAEARRNLVLTVSPTLAKNEHDIEAQGNIVLAPEMMVDKLSENPDHLLDVLNAVSASSLTNQYSNDAAMVRSLLCQGRLVHDRSANKKIALIGDEKEPGKMMIIRTKEIPPTLTAILQSGYAVEGSTFTHVCTRRNMILVTIALILDEMRSEVFEKGNPKREFLVSRMVQCGLHGCTNTKCANGRPLLQCARCKGSFYCCKDHQVRHWKEHKPNCGTANIEPFMPSSS